MLMRDFRVGDRVITPTQRHAEVVARINADRLTVRYEDGTHADLPEHLLKPSYRKTPRWSTATAP